MYLQTNDDVDKFSSSQDLHFKDVSHRKLFRRILGNAFLTHEVSTLRNFKMQSGEYPSSGSVRLDELYVDLTYQRKLRLAKIIQKIIKNEGFCKDVAGTIDVAYRPNRKDPNGRQGMKFVWDGFRRSLMVGLCSPAGSAAKIGASEYDHPIDRSDEECQIDEARKLKD